VTDLSNKQIQSTYKDWLTIADASDANSGLTTTLQAVQDGAGIGCPLQLSTSVVNISPNTAFQLDGTALINNGALQLPILAAEPAASAGLIYFNETTQNIRACIDGINWVDVI
jgi:hypothetical protein